PLVDEGAFVWILSVPGLVPLLVRRNQPVVAGQLQPGAQASALAAGEADLSAVLPYDRAGHGETESDTTGVRVPRALNSVEGFEDLLAFARWYSGSLVVDCYDDALGFGAQADSGAPPVLDRVVDQVGDGAPQGRRTAGNSDVPGSGEFDRLTRVGGVFADS